jgi:HD-GYP domain-containing protein (c-di-GMP phosphodiesterase class II)
VLSHHEHWDGTGYPVGLKGDEIPLLSRIIAVVEYYDRLRKLPPFNKEDGEAACKTALLNQAGKILDPHIVKAFIHMLENENS